MLECRPVVPRRRFPSFPARLPLLVAVVLLSACDSLLKTDIPGSLLFQDDFSRTSSGWDRYADPTYTSDYDEGTYRIAIQSAQTEAWANPGLELDDVRIEVDAASVDGPLDNAFGVLCRYQDPDNYYFFLISGDGYAGIGLTKDGRRVMLTGDAMLPADPILQGYRTNHLRADCSGFDLTLFVNGVLVDQAQAAEWPRGDVGLMAATYSQPGIDIRFDNFSLVRP